MSATAMETLVGFHLALILVLIARQPLARLAGAGWAYALWLLPLARLVLPPIPILSFSTASSTIYLLGMGEGAAPLPSSGGSGQWMPLLLALWAGGAVLFLGWQAAAYARLNRSLTHSGRQLLPYRGLQVVESAAVAAPLAIGFIRRRVVLPPDFRRRFSEAEQKLALMHEAVHHRRGDLWWNLAALILLAANWFSPLAHIAFRRFRADQELACDAAVTARASPSARLDYARALIKSASRPGLIAACPLNHAAQLKRRLKMMNSHSRSARRFLRGAIAFAGLLTLGMTGASAASDEPRVLKNVVIKMIGKNGKEVTLSDKKIAELRARCEQDKSDADASAQDGDKRTRVMICTKDGEPKTPEERAKLIGHLEKAKADMASELGDEHRARIEAALEREIARLREGK